MLALRQRFFKVNFYEKPRTSRTEYCMIEVVADATVVVKLKHLCRPEVSASATLQCTKKWGGVCYGITAIPFPGTQDTKDKTFCYIIYIDKTEKQTALTHARV